jgi:glycosyltransferase involved in cell wall biosynthesis
MSSQWTYQKAEGPTVSVVLPTYNRAHLVGRAIQSVLSQTYGNLELIIVDDGSTDRTREVIGDFQDKRIRYLWHAHNTGAAAARKRGIRASGGRYVAFLDSDDEWMPGKLERQMEVFAEASPVTGIVHTGVWRPRGNRKRYHPSSLRRLAGVIPSKIRRLQGNVHCALQRGNWVTTQAAMVRRECFEEVGGFDELLSRLEEWELWLRISTRDLTQACVESFLRHYPEVNLILIDNGSHDRSTVYLERLARDKESVTCIVNDDNFYHGPAMDQGIRQSVTRYVFTLDSDCEVVKGGFLEGMLELFTDPYVYAVGRLVYMDRYGFEGEQGRSKRIRYIHPYAMLLDKKKYLSLDGFIHHGSPCNRNMRHAQQSGFGVCDFPIDRLIVHHGRGTCSRYGYGLGPLIMLDRLLSRLGLFG